MVHSLITTLIITIFSSAVPSGSGAYQMPTCPSSASILRGGGQSQKRFSNLFYLFQHEAFWDDTNNIYEGFGWIVINIRVFLKVKISFIFILDPLSQKLVCYIFSILVELWTFPRMVLINCPKLGLNRSKGHFSKSERSKLAPFLPFWYISSIYSKSFQ